ncbi:MAG: hypothetical protein K2M95_00375 [Clostridiales bacterium]|nr:hypothetical protein [Clostridiales bacterium]
MEEPQSGRFEALTAFIDYFANTEQAFYSFPPQQTIEKDGKEIPVLQHPLYAKPCEDFLSALGRYTVRNYIEVLKNHGITYRKLSEVDFGEQDALTILSLFTALCRAMRLGSDCDLGQYARKGIIHRMLLRLKEIDDGTGG